MKLAICTKFQVNRMNCVESRKGGPIDPPPPLSRLRVTIFSRRLLGLICVLDIQISCWSDGIHPGGYFGVNRIGMTVGNPRKLP